MCGELERGVSHTSRDKNKPQACVSLSSFLEDGIAEPMCLAAP